VLQLFSQTSGTSGASAGTAWSPAPDPGTSPGSTTVSVPSSRCSPCCEGPLTFGPAPGGGAGGSSGRPQWPQMSGKRRSRGFPLDPVRERGLEPPPPFGDTALNQVEGVQHAPTTSGFAQAFSYRTWRFGTGIPFWRPPRSTAFQARPAHLLRTPCHGRVMGFPASPPFEGVVCRAAIAAALPTGSLVLSWGTGRTRGANAMWTLRLEIVSVAKRSAAAR
jgi:hypothetical protein